MRADISTDKPVQLPVPGMQGVTRSTIMTAVCDRFGITPTDIVSARRGQGVARARQVAMWIAYRRTDWSYPAVGRMFGNRDHTTVMHAVSVIDNLMERDSDFAEIVRRIAGRAEGGASA